MSYSGQRKHFGGYGLPNRNGAFISVFLQTYSHGIFKELSGDCIIWPSLVNSRDINKKTFLGSSNFRCVGF